MFLCNVSLFSIVTSSVSPIAHSSPLRTIMSPVPTKLRQDLHRIPCFHTAAAPTRPLSEQDQSAHNIQTPAPISACFAPAGHRAVLLAAVVVSSLVVLTWDSSSGAGHIVPSVVRPSSCYSLTTLHIAAPEAGFWGRFFSLPLHVSASLFAYHCCLESKITAAGVSPDSVISEPRGAVGSVPRIDQACLLSRSWRSSRQPTSLGSHQSSLPYSATARTHATWAALTPTGTMPDVVVTVWSLSSPALAFLIHQLCSSLRVRCASIQTPSQCVACV